MLSYDGIIRKRLRLKGHPDIPPFQENTTDSAMLSAENLSGVAAEEVTEHHSSPLDSEIQPAGAQSRGGEQRESKEDGQNIHDTRTEAQKGHDEVSQKREKERLSKIAGKSYREHIDVSCCALRGRRVF